MTSSLSETDTPPPPPPPSEAPSSPAGIRTRMEFWKMSLLITASSLLVSSYALFLADRLTPVATQADVDQTAMLVGHELARLYLSHRRFGRVGLIDLGGHDDSQLGLNTLQATLRLDSLMASKLHLDYIGKLVENDARDAGWIGRALAAMEYEQISPGKDHEGGRLFELAKKRLSRNWKAGQLTNLKISLGRLKQAVSTDNIRVTRTPLPAIDGEETAAHARKSTYKAHVPIRIAGNNIYEFTEQSDKMTFCQPTNFELSENQVPSTVLLLEATFDANERTGRGHKVRTLSSCVLLGAPPRKAQKSVFMLSYPHGFFSNVQSLEKLFKFDLWQKNGDTYEAFSGSVPGGGRLIPTTINNANMSAAQAAMLAFYHFIFTLGPEAKPQNVEKVLAQTLEPGSFVSSIPSKPSDALDNSKASSTESNNESDFNSALFKDTGAAKFALAKQSTEGGVGQRVIAEGFSARPLQAQAPLSCFPLLAAPNGFLSLPDGGHFDEAMIADFFTDLHRTNISGIESMRIAETVKSRTDAAIQQCKNKILNLKEEIGSIQKSITTISAQELSATREEQLPQLKDRVIILEVEIEKQEERQKRLLELSSNASLVLQNGKQGAKTSYEIAAHMSSFVQRGLERITAPSKGYLLNRSVVFTPVKEAIAEEDIYEMTESPAAQTSNRYTWKSKDFRVTRVADNSIEVAGAPFSEYKKSSNQLTPNKPVFIMVFSDDLISTSSKPELHFTSQSPFGNSGITQSQFCFFAPGCLQSQLQPGVRLSVLIRDLVATHQKGIGDPVPSGQTQWCLDAGMETDDCPGLAAEVQIRTPVPNAPEFPSRYLQDPAGGPPVPLIPPLPAELL